MVKENNSLEASFIKAVDLHTKGNINEAKDIYEKILEAKPDHLLATGNLGIVFSQLKQFTKAADLFEAMRHDGLRPKVVKVDGGMVMNNWFSQYLADIVNVKVLRPKVHETTALGAAFMAGLQIGVYKSLKDISKNWSLDKQFNPKMKNKIRRSLVKGWLVTIKRTLIN